MPSIEKSKNQHIDNKKMYITFIIIIALIAGIIVFINLVQKNNLGLEVYAPIPEASMEVGDIGNLEIGESIESVNPEAIENPVRPINAPIPTDIFNTSGIILAIQGNSIIVRGLGTNFDDQIKRDLVVLIDENTHVNGVYGDAEYFKKSLKIGDNVSIESPYNIHGKTEFLARYINNIIEE
ncbi:MAG: hypothetical protein PHG24_00665 [Candidatus Pacebacteria bacterium]|nr:hypothetical protein [Candidatus Paceibacterota bacterium]